MRNVVCCLLALLVAMRAEAGTVILFDGSGNITGSIVDPTTPYTYGKIQTETSGLVYKKLAQRGVAATDAVATKTIQGIESVAVGAASGARVGFGGGWIGAVVGAVVGAVLNAAVFLGLDHLISWLFGSGNQVSVGGPAVSPSGWYFNLSMPTDPDTCTNVGTLFFINENDALSMYADWQGRAPVACFGVKPDHATTYTAQGCASPTGQTIQKVTCTLQATFGSAVGGGTETQTVLLSYSNQIPSGTLPADAPTSGTPSAPVAISDAVAQLTDAQRQTQIAPDTVATTVNSLWQQASQQAGYQGMPYDSSNPVTAADAQAWQSANPDAAPTVGDAVGVGSGSGTQGSQATGGSIGALPINNTPGSTDPTPGVNTGGGNAPGGNPGSGTGDPASGTSTGSGGANCGGVGESPCEVDWGSNPNTSQPSLENTPTIAQILSPILNMLPGFNSFQVPTHQGACPQPSFTVFGNTYVLTEHCTLLEQYRTAISGAFALTFLIGLVLILLTA